MNIQRAIEILLYWERVKRLNRDLDTSKAIKLAIEIMKASLVDKVARRP